MFWRKKPRAAAAVVAGITRRDMFKTGGILAAAGAGLSALSGCPHGTRTAEAEVRENLPTRSWEKKPDLITDIANTAECGLVVVGAGNGGTVGAMTAQEKGNDVAETARPSVQSDRATGKGTLLFPRAPSRGR